MMAAYRFLGNDRVSVEALEAALTDPLAPKVEGKHVLLIEDTTEINLAAHSGRLKAADPDLGPVGNDRDVGFLLHPSLVLEADSGFALGLADVHLWNRSWEKLGKEARNYQQQPIEQKESYRWIEATRRAKRLLHKASNVTLIADREADIYQCFSRLPDAKTDLLIRACRERCVEVATDGSAGHQRHRCLLSEHLATLERAGEIEIKLRGNNGRRKRLARLAVRFAEVVVLRPQRLKDESTESVSLVVIEVVEEAATVPSGEKPIRWCLLTTHRVETLADALAMVCYYKARWQIEQLFRLLKSESLEVESSQLECGAAMKKLVVLSLQGALVQLQLVQERDGAFGASASLVFRAEAVVLLGVLQGQLEGKTQKQQCPHAVGTLAWASWVIGRLGGWKGYASQSPPGPVTMKRGLARFMSQYAGWRLAQPKQTNKYV